MKFSKTNVTELLRLVIKATGTWTTSSPTPNAEEGELNKEKNKRKIINNLIVHYVIIIWQSFACPCGTMPP